MALLAQGFSVSTNWFLVNAIPVIIIGAAIGWLLSQIAENDDNGGSTAGDTTQQGSTVGGGGDDDVDDGANGGADGGSNGDGATDNIAVISSALQDAEAATYFAAYEITSTAPNEATIVSTYTIASDADSDPPRSAITFEGDFGGSTGGILMVFNDGETSTFCSEMQCFQAPADGAGALPIPTLFDPTAFVTGAVAGSGVTVVQIADGTFGGITGPCYTVMDGQGVDAEICVGKNTLLHIEGTSPDGDFSFTLKEFREPVGTDFDLPDYPITTIPDGAGGVDTAPSGAALEMANGLVTINWDQIGAPAFYLLPDPNSDDPLCHIHNVAAVDGFLLSLQFFTVYGSAWTGQTGTFPLNCNDPASTGLCVYLDVDASGQIPQFGTGFDVTGTVTIVRLDGTGYRIILESVVFSEGYTIVGPVVIEG